MGQCIGKPSQRKELYTSGAFIKQQERTSLHQDKVSSKYQEVNGRQFKSAQKQNDMELKKNKSNEFDAKVNGLNMTPSLEELQDPFQVNNEQDLRSFTRSSIIKIIKKKGTKDEKKDNQNAKTPTKMKMELNSSEQDILYGQFLSSEKIESTFRITLSNMDLQFMLPKVRAGPLIVPYLDYTQYELQ